MGLPVSAHSFAPLLNVRCSPPAVSLVFFFTIGLMVLAVSLAYPLPVCYPVATVILPPVLYVFVGHARLQVNAGRPFFATLFLRLELFAPGREARPAPSRAIRPVVPARSMLEG
jgi:hypothetical protein